jgi:hypothetical protein
MTEESSEFMVPVIACGVGPLFYLLFECTSPAPIRTYVHLLDNCLHQMGNPARRKLIRDHDRPITSPLDVFDFLFQLSIIRVCPTKGPNSTSTCRKRQAVAW